MPLRARQVAVLMRCLLGWLAALALGWPALAGAQVTADCAPRIVGTQAARADGSARPAAGWEEVTLPEVWTRRWPAHGGSAWYRIDWERPCGPGAEPVALGIDGISVAGEVFINNELLWRDASLVEPLSRSWNLPRWWLLPASALHAGVNTVWVRAVGPVGLSPGLSTVRLGDAATVSAAYEQSQLRQRTLYFINAVLCAMAAALFLLVALVLRDQPAYGWFGVMALSWLAYLSTYLAMTQWPWADSIARARFGMVALVCYVFSACLFTFRFGQQKLPRTERALWALAALGIAASVWAPRAAIAPWFSAVWQGAMLVFLANAVQFQWHAWRPRPGGGQLAHHLLALCWMIFIVVALNDLWSVFDRWQVARNWAAMSGVAVIALVMLLLGGQLAQHIRNMARFNQKLEEGVAHARAELAEVSAREHAQALRHAKLNERMQIAHDLHDSLGGGLVRGMALVEQAPTPLSNERVLSLLKTLRDDLRQVIDHGSSHGAEVPDTPVQWLAPLRHRFTRIFDELGIASVWRVSPQWMGTGGRPSALQCLLLTRLIEEALSNVIKHSRARHVWVECSQPGPGVFAICIEDDGVGFDVGAVQRAGMSVGMRSMAARAERMGAQFHVESVPGRTLLSVSVPLAVPVVAPQDGV